MNWEAVSPKLKLYLFNENKYKGPLRFLKKICGASGLKNVVI
jgi:hypothetical protein